MLAEWIPWNGTWRLVDRFPRPLRDSTWPGTCTRRKDTESANAAGTPTLHAGRKTPMMDATMHMTVPPEKWKEILQTFKAILGPIRSEQGCISCHCYVDAETDNTIFFKNEWETMEALESHLRSVHFSVLIGVMKLLDRQPNIRFDTITSTAGAEAITAARRSWTAGGSQDTGASLVRQEG